MNRRAFIAAICAPLFSRVAFGGNTYRLGFISTSTTDKNSPFLDALRQGLQARGYEEGKNLEIDYCFGQTRDQLPAMADRLVKSKVNIILAGGSEGIVAARAATTTIPIVMTNSGDAVREGFAKSLSEPGGNITGMTQISPELVGKRLEILKAVFGDLKDVAILWNPVHPSTPIEFHEARQATEKLSLNPYSVEVREPPQISAGLRKVAAEGVRGVLVIRDPFTVRNREAIIRSLNELKMLAVFATSDFVESGGLMHYGADFSDLFRQSAIFVDKILKGSNPATLPIMQPTKFELVINHKVANERGIVIPPFLLARADRVIE